MPSPFPGMDPYLERSRRDVHQRLVVYACDQLQPRLPSGLRARVEERVFLETEEGDVRRVYPDIHVVEQTGSVQRRGVRGDVAVAEPLVFHIANEPVTQSFLQIIESGSGGRVITLIEFLSPTNKTPGEGQRLYLRKRQEAMAAGANVVEIDLTRDGRRILLIPEEVIPPVHRTAYRICVWRASLPDSCEYYRAPLQTPLPAIRVPLREKDPDVALELEPLIDLAYENGRYENLDYLVDPEPPLAKEEADWARELLRSKGLRS